MNSTTLKLKREIAAAGRGDAEKFFRILKRDAAYRKHMSAPPAIMRALTFSHLLLGQNVHMYENDLIVGSTRGVFINRPGAHVYSEADREGIISHVREVGERGFGTNADHAAPDYGKLVRVGIVGLRDDVKASMAKLEPSDPEYDEKRCFLESVDISLRAFSKFICRYAVKARRQSKTAPTRTMRERLRKIADVCENIASRAPATFREALQLIWFAHIVYWTEGRYAMALGRIDQFLWDFYRKDTDAGILTRAEALKLFENALMKMSEDRAMWGGDNVVNISVGGMRPDGKDGTNEVSFIVLEAVKNCHIVGPNLSARFCSETPREFYIKCLEVIRSGIGYPALFNDDVNVPALASLGYTIEDARNHCFVGCIENFIQGKQRAWTDSRFNTPKYIELALNNGRSMQTGELVGIETGDPLQFDTFDKFMDALERQIEYAAQKHTEGFISYNAAVDPKIYISPFLSALFDDCIARARDINDGGAHYPFNHGAACMGIGTVADSLAALEHFVYKQKSVTMETLLDALKADFKGYEPLQEMLKNQSPKYGNNDDAADKFAVWYVRFHRDVFSRYSTPDGGHFIILIAANTNNVGAGLETHATPDGRNAKMPLSDAGSPTYGVDRQGITSVINSVTKPDYTLVSGGSVINQKLHPNLLKDEAGMMKVASMLKTYFDKGGQEMQINIVDNKTLREALKYPEKHRDLIVRVSGFSARFIELSPLVKEDILRRTQHTF